MPTMATSKKLAPKRKPGRGPAAAPAPKNTGKRKTSHGQGNRQAGGPSLSRWLDPPAHTDNVGCGRVQILQAVAAPSVQPGGSATVVVPTTSVWPGQSYSVPDALESGTRWERPGGAGRGAGAGVVPRGFAEQPMTVPSPRRTPNRAHGKDATATLRVSYATLGVARSLQHQTYDSGIHQTRATTTSPINLHRRPMSAPPAPQASGDWERSYSSSSTPGAFVDQVVTVASAHPPAHPSFGFGGRSVAQPGHDPVFDIDHWTHVHANEPAPGLCMAATSTDLGGHADLAGGGHASAVGNPAGHSELASGHASLASSHADLASGGYSVPPVRRRGHAGVFGARRGRASAGCPRRRP